MSDNPDPYNLIRLPIEYWAARDIQTYEKNNKVHSKEHVDTLKKSIEQFGLMDPIIVDVDGVIIAGHGRFAALQELGQIEKIPVRHAKGLTKNQADAARIAHNKTASTEYDTEATLEEIARLAQFDFDMSALGISEKELEVATLDVGEMDLGALSDNLDADIDAQESSNRDKIEAAAAGETPIAKVIGFKAIPVKDEKTFRAFIARIERQTGQTGYAAWLSFVEDYDGREA